MENFLLYITHITLGVYEDTKKLTFRKLVAGLVYHNLKSYIIFNAFENYNSHISPIGKILKRFNHFGTELYRFMHTCVLPGDIWSI